MHGSWAMRTGVQTHAEVGVIWTLDDLGLIQAILAQGERGAWRRLILMEKPEDADILALCRTNPSDQHHFNQRPKMALDPSINAF